MFWSASSGAPAAISPTSGRLIASSSGRRRALEAGPRRALQRALAADQLEGARLRRVAAEEAGALEVREVRMHRRGRGQADLFADLAHRRRVAVAVDVLDQEVPDLLLALGEHEASVVGSGGAVTNVCSTRRVESPADGVNRTRGSCAHAVAARTIGAVANGGGAPGRRRPRRLDRLPEQYFGALLGRVAAAAARGGPPLVDLGRGNPEVGPPAARRRGAARGALPARRPRLRAAPRPAASCARRSPRRYADALRRRRSTPSARSQSSPARRPRIVELALVLAERGDRILLPDPYYPDYPSGVALAGAELGPRPRSTRTPGWQPDLDAAPPGRRALPQLSRRTPAPSAPRPAPSRRRSTTPARTGHGDRPRRRLQRPRLRRPRGPRASSRRPGAKDVGVEMWTMSKTYGMAGWRIGFVARQRRDRRADQPDERPLARRDLRPAAARGDRGARRAAGRASRSGAPTYERRRDRARRGAARAAGLRGHVLRLAAAARGRDRRAAARASSASRSPRARGSARAAPAGRGSRSPSPTRRSSAGIERLAPVLAAAYA